MGDKLKTYLFYVCAILLVVSAALYITENKYIPYVYAVAGAGVAVVYLTSPYRGDNFRLKRLNIQQTIAAVLLPVSSYLMFHKNNVWFALLFISAILQLYIVIIRNREENNGKNS